MDSVVPRKHSCVKAICIIFAMLVLLCGLLGWAVFSAVAEPTNVARSFIQALADNQQANAYALTSVDFQTSYSPEAFTEFAVSHPNLTKITDITFNDRSVKDDTAKIQGRVTTPDGTFPVVVELIRTSSVWHVERFNIH